MVRLPPAFRVRRAVLLVIALVLPVACSGEGDGSSPVASDTAPASSAPAPSATEPPSPGSTAPAGSRGTGAGSTVGPGTTRVAPPVRPTLAQVRVGLQRLGTFAEPVAIATRPNDPVRGRFYVVERAGLIRAVEADGSSTGPPTLDARDLTVPGGERGLLGAAFSPDGTKLYVNYTGLDGHTNVDELVVNAAGVADPTTRRRLLLIEQPFANHNGGHLAFGKDGLLYIGTGDGGSGGDPAGYAQNPASLLGKMLRIDPTASGGSAYRVPPDNPFVGQPGVRAEIWSLGLRNPWRYSFDGPTGDLWIADVGQGLREEIDVARSADGLGRGANYGWNIFEGTNRYGGGELAGAVAPYFEYDHGSRSDQGCSITGGVVYRQATIAGLAGAYLYADFCVGGIRAIDSVDAPDARVLLDQPGSVASFGLDPDGEVLVVDLTGGLYRLVAAS